MSHITKQWIKGPVNDRLIDGHDQPITCISMKGTELVTGSTDHSLKVYDIVSGKMKRQLYNKQYGHREWISSVDYALDGRILSGGLDSKICLWNEKFVKCDDLIGHRGAISMVKCGKTDSTSHIAISSSYDKTLKVWDLNAKNKKQSCVHTLYNIKGHNKAVHNFYWNNSLIVSGGRDALCCVWDINTSNLIQVLEQHVAPITSIQIIADDNDCGDILITGAKDGYVNIWDLRTGKPQYKIDCVKGSINDIKLTNPLNTPKDPTKQIIVGGSDKKIYILDPRMNFKISKKIEGHKDVITTISIIDNLILSGGGNGWVLVHDIYTGKCLYGVGASEKGKCNCIDVVAPEYFVAAGDDGNVVIFEY